MKALIPALILILFAQFSFSQKSPAKFGNISLEDLKMTTYANDSSAAAFYLFDYGEAYVASNASGLVLNFERHFRIKILKTEGLEYANLAVGLWRNGSSEEKVTSLKAVTYNLENGSMVESKMSKEGVFKEKVNKNMVLQKFTLPNVKVGSVIECSYTVVSEYYWRFPNWRFQYKIPVQHSEYWSLIPEFFIFEKYMQGYVAPTSYEVKRMNSTDFNVDGHHWIIKNVPAFKEELFMTSESDYMAKVNFAISYVNVPGRPVLEIMGSWKKLNDELLEDESFGKVITGSNFLKKKVDELTAGMTDQQQKVAVIHDYVKQNMEWDGFEDIYPDNLKDAMELKKGSSADINLMLASMLEKAGIPVEAVLLSTRDHGFVRQSYPMQQQFNYVICQARIGDKTILLDATDKFLPMNVLPKRCLNGEGLVISKLNHGWVKLESKAKAKTVVNADVALSTTGELKGKVVFAYDGYDAHDLREEFAEKGEQDYLKDFLGDKNWTVEKTEFLNVKETNLPAKQIHEVTIFEHATVSGDVFYINPFVSHQETENVFSRENREYPVDFGTLVEKTYLSKITLPEGFTVDELPKSKVMMLPGNAARFSYNVTLTGNTITTVSMLQINKSLFIQTEYPDLREFYSQLVAKQSEQIVVRKK